MWDKAQCVLPEKRGSWLASRNQILRLQGPKVAQWLQTQERVEGAVTLLGMPEAGLQMLPLVQTGFTVLDSKLDHAERQGR